MAQIISVVYEFSVCRSRNEPLQYMRIHMHVDVCLCMMLAVVNVADICGEYNVCETSQMG